MINGPIGFIIPKQKGANTTASILMDFDDKFFDQVGLSRMKAEDRPAFAKYIRERLEIRIGSRFTRQMTEQQVDELNKILDNPDKQVVSDWLSSNIPNYRNVVADEVARLKAEIRANAAAILSVDRPPASDNQPASKS